MNKMKVKIVIGIIAVVILSYLICTQIIKYKFGHFELISLNNILKYDSYVKNIYKLGNNYLIIDNNNNIYIVKITQKLIQLLHKKELGLKNNYIPTQLNNENILFYNIDENYNFLGKVYYPETNDIKDIDFTSTIKFNPNIKNCVIETKDFIILSGNILKEPQNGVLVYSNDFKKINEFQVGTNIDICQSSFFDLDQNSISFVQLSQGYINNMEKKQLVLYDLNIHTGQIIVRERIFTNVSIIDAGFFGGHSSIVKLENNNFVLFEYSEKDKINYITVYKVHKNKLEKTNEIIVQNINYNLGKATILQLNKDEFLISGGRSGVSAMMQWDLNKAYLLDFPKKRLFKVSNTVNKHNLHSALKINENEAIIYDGIYSQKSKYDRSIEYYMRGKLW